MGELTLNKIFGALLAILLVILGLSTLSHGLFAPAEPHHDDHGEALSLNEQIAQRYAYYVPIADGGAAGAGEEEEVFDLGLALASADVERGERSFRAKCATCHTIEEGGANGTGPNLYGVIGNDIATHAGFGYSGALSGVEGDWSYARMNEWLYNPGAYARGTSMAFAGLRRDDERVNVMAYLASFDPNPPAFPEPLAAEVTEGEPVAEAIDESPSVATGELATQDAITDVNEITDEMVGEMTEEVIEQVGEANTEGADPAELPGTEGPEAGDEEVSEETPDETEGE